MFLPRWICSLLLPALSACAGLGAAMEADAQDAKPFRVTLRATEKGAEIDAGRVGRFTLSPPLLLDAAKKEAKPVEATTADGAARFRYADGTGVTLTAKEGEFAVTFSGLPAAVKSFRMDMHLPFGLAQGGKWSIGGGDETPFPATFEGKSFLYQGNADRFSFLDPQGQGLAFQVPQHSYQQLQDNRAWNWKIFAWFFMAPTSPGVTTYTIKVAPAGSAAPRRVVLADRFGQNPRMEWPGKVKSEAELRADVEAEKGYYAGLAAPERDAYGGLPGSREKLGLKRTGFFHVEKKGERWFLVDPEGNLFFHLGVCSALSSIDDCTKIQGREGLFEWLPDRNGEYAAAFRPNSPGDFSFYLANVVRKYGKPFDKEEWSRRMVERYRKWGFNSCGAFTGPTEASREMRFPYVAGLPLGEWDGKMRSFLLGRVRGIFDPFHPRVVDEIERLFAERLPQRADDPLIIGYFLANEQAFEDIPKVIPTLVGGVPAKDELVRMLREKYGDIARFNEAWNLKAESFEALRNTGLAVATRHASADMLAYTERFLDAYYGIIARTFRKHNRNHMLIGNRWQPSTANSEVLCRAAGKYLDVISVNYYTYGIDAAYLRRLHEWSGGKPFIFSEFHYACPKESGLPGGLNEMGTQRERGLAYRNYVEQAAALGFVVGIEWFSGIDQAVTGRYFDGENGNIGLLSVADRPYRDLVAEMKKTNDGIYQVLLGERAPFVLDDPRFRKGGAGRRSVVAPRAPGRIALDGTTTGWPGTPPLPIPGDRLVLGADAEGFEASFRVAYDDANLYLSVDVRDATPMQNRHGGPGIWNSDAVEVFIGAENLEQPGPLQFGDRQILLSAGKPEEGAAYYYANAPRQYACPLSVVASPDGKGYTLQAAIPFEALGAKPVPGKEFLFDLAVDDGPDGRRRVRQLMWNGGAKNSSDRSYWGRLKLGG